MKSYAFLAVSVLMSTSVLATPCDEVKAQVAAKLDAKHVANYALDAVPSDQQDVQGKVVGVCEAGKKKIIYTRKSAEAAAPASAPAAASAAG
jgi:hypothetical protein